MRGKSTFYETIIISFAFSIYQLTVDYRPWTIDYLPSTNHKQNPMDFEKVLEILISEFEKEEIRYALIGGFAMGALGILRSTMDLDFLVDSRDLPKIEKRNI